MFLQQPPTMAPTTKTVRQIISRSHSTPTPLIPQQQNSQETEVLLFGEDVMQMYRTIENSMNDRLKIRQQGNKELGELLDNALLKHREEMLEYYREIKKYGEELKQILTKNIQRQQEFSTLNVRLSHLEDQQTNAQCNSLQQALSNLNTRLSQLENQYTSLKYFTLTLLIILSAGAIVFPTKITAILNHLIHQSTTP